MTTTNRPRSIQKTYPPSFTHLLAEVADTAMKAIIEPDPARYIQGAAVSSALELRRLRCDQTPEHRRDPDLAAAFRCDVVRIRVVRDLATDIVEAYERLRRAENTVVQIANCEECSGRRTPANRRQRHVPEPISPFRQAG